MLNRKTLYLLGAVSFSVLTLAGCEEGPAEEAGEEIDELVTDAGNAIEDACEKVKEGAKADDPDC